MNYAYWFAAMEGIGVRTKHQILAQTGSAKELYFLPEHQLKELKGMTPEMIRSIQTSKKGDVEAAYSRMCARGITFLSIEENSYPKRLKTIADAPIGLYVKGRLPEEGQRTVAIVGARMCSEYGRAAATELGRQLASRGICVVSGMARGIDAAGHLGALAAGGMTCAVLGCGVDVCYPESNRKLYADILDSGCILSEYPPGMQPRPAFFPQRNRIISGMSEVIVVVEARARSGSLITADFALEQGREIYAVPGRIFDSLSAGCNSLIRQGAGIVSNIEDFLKELDLCIGTEGVQETFEKLLLEKEERLVYSCLDLQPRSVEELLNKTQYSMQQLAIVLDGLMRKELIAENFKNYYVKKV